MGMADERKSLIGARDTCEICSNDYTNFYTLEQKERVFNPQEEK